MSLPLVSILIPTFRRPLMLAECVESARRQDYRGQLQLVVVNDDPSTTLRMHDYPCDIINSPTRFPTLGDKRNRLMREVRGDIVQWWDDDDIALPDHVSRAVSRLTAGREPAVRLHRVYEWNGTAVRVVPPQPLCGVTMTAIAMREVGDFPSVDRDEDLAWRRVALGMRWFHGEDHHKAHHAPTFIYRAHSGPRCETHTPDQWNAAHPVDADASAQQVAISPVWFSDYTATCRNATKVPLH